MTSLEEIRPRSIVFLFSAGKDSSLALLYARDIVKQYAEKSRARVYIVYIYVTGNTHPANAYCASSVMLWHKRHYGFEPVWLARDRVFQEYVARYGLQIGPQRWCYTEFKEKPLRELHRKLPKPVLYVDGMSPHDNKHREQIIKGEIELVKSRNRGEYWAWHPLYSRKLSAEEKLSILEQHEELSCVARLYRLYNDSMNCVICPYRMPLRTAKALSPENVLAAAAGNFLSQATRSRQWQRLATLLQTPPITSYKAKAKHHD